MARHSPDSPAAIVAEGIPADRVEEAASYLRSIGAVSVRSIMDMPVLTYEHPDPEPKPSEPITANDLLLFEKDFRYPDHTAEIALSELSTNEGTRTPFNQICLAHADNPEALCAKKLSKAINSAICLYKTTKNALVPQLGITPETFAFLMHVDRTRAPKETLPRPRLYVFDHDVAAGGLFVTPDTIRTFSKDFGCGRPVQNDFVRLWGQSRVAEILDGRYPKSDTHLIDGILATLSYDHYDWPRSIGNGGEPSVYTSGIEAERFVSLVDTPEDTQNLLTIPTIYVVHRLARAIQEMIETMDYTTPPNSYQ